MKIYDISLTVTPSLPVWPGDPAIVLERISKMEEGENNNVSRLETSVHAGTHVDAPYHFLQEGKTIESLPLEVLVGPAQVIALGEDVDLISADVLKSAGLEAGTERVLFKTRNSKIWERNEPDFQTGFVAVSPDGASYLVEQGIRLVGVDYLSVAPYKQSTPTHRILLGASMVILEGVDLTGVPAGHYELCCLPLKLGGSDGAPARAILIERP
jgi:arylformamidase